MCGTPVTFAISKPADVVPGPLQVTLEGLAFEIRTPRGTVKVESTLVGRPNVYNILAASATAVSLGLPLDAIAEGVRALPAYQVASRSSPRPTTR